MDIPKKKIFYTVLFIHLVFLGLFTREKTSPKNQPGEIHVKTYVQREKKPVPVKKQTFAIAQSTTKKQNPPIAQSTTKKQSPAIAQSTTKKRPAITKKKTAKKSTASTQKGTPRVSNSLLQELRQNMDSISSSTQKFEKKEIAVPKKILDLQIDHPAQVDGNTDEVPFEALLSETLKNGLTLPDYGEVRARITLHPNGSLAQLEILESKSHRNESYLKNRLQEIAFPCFNSATTEKKVVITFKNQ